MSRLFFALALIISMASQAMAEPRAELVMVEQAGCAWCARWNRDIAPIYPKTDVGAAAPLRRIDLNDPRPADLEFARPVTFTPTFVIMVDGVEVSRIEGYPGEDFFWALLEHAMADQGLFTLPQSG